MPRGVRRNHCKICERHVSECGGLSARGKCEECGLGRLAANMYAISSHSGPEFTRWRRAMAASVGGALLDDQRSAP